MADEPDQAAEFPIICEDCLGPNPYIRMIKDKFGEACKVCRRPFTVYRWNAQAGQRFKKTEACKTCAKIKNVCQTCLLDVDTKLPSHLRDKAFGIADLIPHADRNREWTVNNLESLMEKGALVLPYGQSNNPTREFLKKVRSEPYPKRITSGGSSTSSAPSTSQNPTNAVTTTSGPGGPMPPPKREYVPKPMTSAKRDIMRRFQNASEQVVDRILDRVSQIETAKAPKDRSITTLFIGNIVDSITEADLRHYFSQFGEVKHINMVYRSGCAFLTFAQRHAAERAIVKVHNDCVIKDRFLRVHWAKPRGQVFTYADYETHTEEAAVDYSGQYEYYNEKYGAPPPEDKPINIPPPPGSGEIHYASMNPTQFGSKVKRDRE